MKTPLPSAPAPWRNGSTWSRTLPSRASPASRCMWLMSSSSSWNVSARKASQRGWGASRSAPHAVTRESSSPGLCDLMALVLRSTMPLGVLSSSGRASSSAAAVDVGPVGLLFLLGCLVGHCDEVVDAVAGV